MVVSLCPGYNAPYLSVYSENAVDVFDVNNMEWIQTIPLKKVRRLWLHLVARYCVAPVLWLYNYNYYVLFVFEFILCCLHIRSTYL